MNSLLKSISLIILILSCSSANVQKTATKGEQVPEKIFPFTEYDYSATSKNEIGWREWEAACEQTPVCIGLTDLEKVKCVRKCMSPSCYNELYAFDELEEGEIDIRHHSFKGCFASRLGRRRF